MRRLIEQILKPNNITLTMYGTLSLIFLIVYVWNFSFVWEFVFSVTHYIIAMLVTMLIGLIIAFLLDRKFDWRLKGYFIISIIQLFAIWTVANPIRTWQIESSLEKARLIIAPLETYRKQYGTYPETLGILERKLNVKLPKRTNLGTRYWYEIENSKDYRLWFVSYYGNTAYYNNELDKWIITD